MNRVVVLILVSLLMSACSTTKVSYTSQVDPDFSFTADKAISVVVSDKNALITKHYVEQVINGLKERGFHNVYYDEDLNETDMPIDIVVVISVDKDSRTYQYQGADYGMVDSGRTIINCTGNGYSTNCTSNNQKTFGVTGYSTKTGNIGIHFFSTVWFELISDQEIMFTFASLADYECSDLALYEFLIDETLKRLDFEKPSEYEYSVEIPETYTCMN